MTEEQMHNYRLTLMAESGDEQELPDWSTILPR